MKRTTILFTILLSITGCEEPEPEMLGEYETRQLEHEIWEFQIYPGSTYLPENTEAYQRAHFLMNPGDDEAPKMAVYETEDPVEDVAAFYAERYGFGEVAPNKANDFKPFDPPAYLTKGSLGEETAQIRPMLEQLELPSDIEHVEGDYQGAHIDGVGRYPRVTLQRPWYDVASGEVRDTTKILMVLEL